MNKTSNLIQYGLIVSSFKDVDLRRVENTMF